MNYHEEYTKPACGNVDDECVREDEAAGVDARRDTRIHLKTVWPYDYGTSEERKEENQMLGGSERESKTVQKKYGELSSEEQQRRYAPSAVCEAMVRRGAWRL